MGRNRSELLDQAILRLVDLPRSEQDRIAIEILADLCSEEEWAVVVASEPYQTWLAAQPDEEPERNHASLRASAV
ncbi:MAG: hypothetical protein ACLP7P_13465 [Rhodomicrobium sp.]